PNEYRAHRNSDGTTGLDDLRFQCPQWRDADLHEARHRRDSAATDSQPRQRMGTEQLFARAHTRAHVRCSAIGDGGSLVVPAGRILESYRGMDPSPKDGAIEWQRRRSYAMGAVVG